jgi:hypothetical protein
MAGMFYTLQEVIEKLGKTEAEIKVFVREGRLREFRDGAKQLYKTEDVEALLGSAAKHDTAILDDSLQISIDETGDVSLAPEELDALINQDTSKNNAQETKAQLDDTGELLAEETLGGTPKKPSKEKTRKPKTDDEIELMPAESTKAGTKAPSTPASDSLSLIDSKHGADTSNEDTRISPGGDSINVLSESENDFKISDDTSSKTKVMQQKPKALDQKGGGGRLDDDMNLDGGGSGSGLLDLSLQADDTSLGAVLDDIYPESPGGTPAAEQTPGAGAAVAEEAEKILEQPESAEIPQGTTPQEAAVLSGVSYVAAEPLADSSSNVFGVILFVPLIVLTYTTIVVISGYKPILNLQISSSIEPIIWYVAAGIGAVVVLVALIGSFSGKGGPKKPKAPKEPKVKKVKPPKEKKGKKGAEQATAEAK